jgi:hypothetical protein
MMENKPFPAFLQHADVTGCFPGTLCRANVQCRSATITGLPIYPLMMRNLIELKDAVPLQFIETVGCARVVLEG